MNIIISAANLIQRIGNPELRDTAAYALDEIHSWRCGIFDSGDECRAVADAFVRAEFRDGDLIGRTAASERLQPLSSFSAWYLAGPFVRWVQTLQDIDRDTEAVRWRFHRDFLRPWRFLPGLRSEFDLVARFAASRTWYGADMFIARYIAEAAPRLKDGCGTSMFFYGDDIPEDLSRACYEHSLDVLADLATAAVEDFDGHPMQEFMDALGEAVMNGMLWD